jgi:hypothetical protein
MLVTFLLGLAMLPATTLQAMPIDKQWTFRVYLDDREIGFHEFKVSGEERQRQVEINARFDVKILFFNAYKYEHRNRESWIEDCLAGIESETNDNGEVLTVSGESTPESFEIETNEQSETLSMDCVRSFAYWNPAILESEQLLNSQTGELMAVTVSPAGPDRIRFGKSELEAIKYTLETDDGPISLWYTPDRQYWLALEAPAKGGRTIRYEPIILPDWPQDRDSLAME